MVPLAKDMKFRVIWPGHEECCEGRVYQIKSIYKDCTCPKPNYFINGEQPIPRKPHVHIKADLVDCPFEMIYSSGFWFTVFEDTLTDPENPDHKIELIEVKEVQLTLF